MNKKINIAVIGLGNIGSYFCKEILKQKKDIIIKTGIDLNLLYVSAKKKNKKRSFKFKNKQWIYDPLSITCHPLVDIVVELIGGSDGMAKKIVISAIKNKKHVITANKALIAKHGNFLAIFCASPLGSAVKTISTLFKYDLGYEASVAGGVPIVRGIKEGLISNKIFKLIGILNGTSNYILSNMEKTGKSFKETLKESQNSGFAETNPKEDLNGQDVASKIKILSSLCFRSLLSQNSMLINGIENIEIKDIILAKKLGFRIKLLGLTEINNGKIFERVHPALVNINSYIGNINGILNAIIINSKQVTQPVVMQGEGAGPGPTTSSLMSDLYSILRGNINYPFIIPYKLRKKIKSFNFLNYKYSCYFRLEVKDKPGVLSSITKFFC